MGAGTHGGLAGHSRSSSQRRAVPPCRGREGQTGHPTPDNTCLPQPVAALRGRRVVQVAAGGRHTLALTQASELYAWGNADSGQLSLPPDAGSQCTPQLVRGLPKGRPILFVAAGSDHSIAVVDGSSSDTSAVGG